MDPVITSGRLYSRCPPAPPTACARVPIGSPPIVSGIHTCTDSFAAFPAGCSEIGFCGLQRGRPVRGPRWSRSYSSDSLKRKDRSELVSPVVSVGHVAARKQLCSAVRGASFIPGHFVYERHPFVEPVCERARVVVGAQQAVATSAARSGRMDGVTRHSAVSPVHDMEYPA